MGVMVTCWLWDGVMMVGWWKLNSFWCDVVVVFGDGGVRVTWPGAGR